MGIIWTILIGRLGRANRFICVQNVYEADCRDWHARKLAPC